VSRIGACVLVFWAANRFNSDTASCLSGMRPIPRPGIPRPSIIVPARLIASEACQVSLTKKVRGRSADRRTDACGASVGSGPITQARASPRRPLSQAAQPGDARLSALHRGGLLAPSLPGDAFGRCLARRFPLASPSAFAGPARSGGRAVLLEASRASGYEPNTQDAASRSDSGSSPETPSVSGTGRTIGAETELVNEKIPITSRRPEQARRRRVGQRWCRGKVVGDFQPQ
jgi:hypothetical protein